MIVYEEISEETGIGFTVQTFDWLDAPEGKYRYDAFSVHPVRLLGSPEKDDATVLATIKVVNKEHSIGPFQTARNRAVERAIEIGVAWAKRQEEVA